MAATETLTPSWEQFAGGMAQHGLTDTQMSEAKSQYFERYIAPHFTDKELPDAWTEFSKQASVPKSSSMAEEFGKGAMRGVNTLGQGLVGTVATGMESVERNFPGTIAPENMSRIREMERQQTRDRAPYQSGYSDWDNVHGVSDFGKFIAANTGEGLATSAPMLTGAGIPGAIAGAAVTELGGIHKQAADRAEAKSYLDGTDPNKSYENIDTGKLAGGTALATTGEVAGALLGPFRQMIAPTGTFFAKPFDLLGKLGTKTQIGAKTALAVGSEGATEFGQTFAEEYGSGNPNWHSPEVVDEAKSAAISAMGGALVPGAGGAVYDRYRGDKTPPAAEPVSSPGSQDPGVGQLPPPEPPPETEEQRRDKQYAKDADILSRVQGISPNAFDAVKKGDDPNKPLEFKDYRKRAEQAWKDTVPTPSQEEVMPSFLEAAQQDPSLTFDKFYKEAIKTAQDEHARANPKPTDAELVQAYQAYRFLHGAGVRSFDEAHQTLRDHHYPDQKARQEKDITPPNLSLPAPEKQNALPAPLGQQYRDAADAIERGDYGPPSAESAALLRNIADRHEQAVQKLNEDNAAKEQPQGGPVSVPRSEAEVLQQLYGLPGRGQTDMFGMPPSAPREVVASEESEDQGPSRGVQTQINFESPALPAPIAYKLRQEADAIERGDYGPGHPLAVQALRSAADRYDAETRQSQEKAEAAVLKDEARRTPPNLPPIPSDTRRQEVRNLGMPPGIPPTSKPKKTVADHIADAMAAVAGDNKGKLAVLKGMKKGLETLAAPDVDPQAAVAAMREANDVAKLKPENQKLREAFINDLERRILNAKSSTQQSVGVPTEGESQRSEVRGETQGQSETDNASEGKKVDSKETTDAVRPTGEAEADVSGAVGEVQKTSGRKSGATRVSRLSGRGESDGGTDSNVRASGADEGTVSSGSERGSPLESTAPEHANVGVDDRELGEIVSEFNRVQAASIEDGDKITHVFDAPSKGEVVRLGDKAKVYHKDHGWMTPAEAKKKIADWKKNAEAQGKDRSNSNHERIVLSLFDLTGSWSAPWEEAGYQVYRFDIQDDPELGDVNKFSTEFFNDTQDMFEGRDIYAILAACPCTDFASSGARHFAAKDSDGRTVASVKLVHQTLATIEYFKPAIWAVENPVGRIEKLGGLPPWRLSFDPNHIGDPYTKKTLLWGRFNADLPIAPVEPTEGSKMHKLYGGKSLATKNARSATPEGFAYGFFAANNAVDHPVMAIANRFDRLDRSLIEKAVEAGVTEDEIANAVEDYYYQDLDDAAANDAIRDLISEKGNPLIRFSRPKNGKPASVLSPGFVKSTAEGFARDSLRGINVEVVPDESALPKEILDQAQKDGALGEIGAVHWDGRVILVANRMKSVKDIKEAILHEGTHLGRMKLFQGQAKKAYNRLWNRLGGHKGIVAWSDKLGTTEKMQPYWDTAKQALNSGEDQDEIRYMLVDEFLANTQGTIAEEGKFSMLGRWVKEFWGAVRQAARSFGVKIDGYTESDLRYLLKNLREAARETKLEGSLGDPIRFSRKPKDVVNEVSERVTDYVKDAYQDKIPTAAKLLLNPHQLATLYPKFPTLRKIAHLLDSMQAETVRKQQAFASIVEDIAALPSAVRGQLLDVMTSATLYDLHPDVAFRDTAGLNAHLLNQAGKEILHSKVAAQYRALPKDAKNLYVRARDEFIKSWNERFEAVRQLTQRLDLPEKERAKINEELNRISAKVKGPYFPLFREGNWTVVWKSPAMVAAEEANDRDTIDALKGNPSDFFYFRTDSKSLAKRVAETVPAGMAEGSSSEGPYRHVKNDSSAQGVTTEFMQKVEAAISSRLGGARQDEAEEAISALRSVFVNAMPDMSVMKRTLARRGVAGVSSDDMLKAIARAGSADAFYLSRIKFADRLTRLLQELRQEDTNPRRGETVDKIKSGSPKGGDGGIYQSMLINYRANMQPPDESLTTGIANKLTAIHYFKTLVLSPAFMITNMAQPWMVSLPVMSSRFSDKLVSKELGQATLEAFNLAKPKSLKPEDLAKYELDLSKIKDEDERKMLEVLKDRGRIEISQARDLATLAKTNAYWANRAMRVGASFSHMTETVNRLAAALSSYRLERQRLEKDPNVPKSEIERRATEYADEIVRDTQVDYSPAGMPTFMKMGRQGLRRLMFQYKRYMQAMAFLYWKIGSEAFAGDKQALKAFGGLTLTHFLAAGMSGVAIYPLLKAIGAIGADDDETPEEWLDAMALEMAGGDKKLARAIRLGLPTYMGVDLSKKVGQGDLATLGVRFDPQGDTTPEKITNFLADLIPSLDVLTSAGKAWDTFQQTGDLTKAFGSFGFKPFSDLTKTADVSEQGLTNKAGTVQYIKPEQYDWADKMWKSLGFSPVIESEHYRAVEAKSHKEDFYKTERGRLLDGYVRAKQSGDATQVKDSETAMKEFSNKVPDNMKEFKIRAQDWIKHLNATKRQNKRMDETGVSLPKKGGKWIEETVSPYEVSE